MTHRALIPEFRIAGTSSYPKGVLEVREIVQYLGKTYFLCTLNENYAGDSVSYDNYILEAEKVQVIQQINNASIKALGRWDEALAVGRELQELEDPDALQVVRTALLGKKAVRDKAAQLRADVGAISKRSDLAVWEVPEFTLPE